MLGCRVTNVGVAAGETGGPDDDMAFEITLDVAEPLKQDALFRCVYVVDASRPDLDVELEGVDIGNDPGVPQGMMKFTLEAPAPARAQIVKGAGPSAAEVCGLYISAIYRGTEFCRVGYFVRYEYTDPALREAPPEEVDWAKLRRVLSEPRVTRFPCAWDAAAAAPAASAQQASASASASLLQASAASQAASQGAGPAALPGRGLGLVVVEGDGEGGAAAGEAAGGLGDEDVCRLVRQAMGQAMAQALEEDAAAGAGAPAALGFATAGGRARSRSRERAWSPPRVG